MLVNKAFLNDLCNAACFTRVVMLTTNRDVWMLLMYEEVPSQLRMMVNKAYSNDLRNSTCFASGDWLATVTLQVRPHQDNMFTTWTYLRSLDIINPEGYARQCRPLNIALTSLQPNPRHPGPPVNVTASHRINMSFY